MTVSSPRSATTSAPKSHARPFDNLVLVVPHKHGSTWLFRLFSDERMLSAMRMSRSRDAEPRNEPGPWTYRWPHGLALAPGELAYTRILTPDQINRDDVLSQNCRAVYVHRDPRDTVISHYFSLRFSHGLMGGIERIRNRLRELSFSDGMLHTIRLQVEMRRYETQRSWKLCADPRILNVRYEDLISDPLPTVSRVLAHFGCDMPKRSLNDVLEDFSFEATCGRKLGQVDLFAHNRSGLPGQWKQFLDRHALEMLQKEAGNLLEQLGYERDDPETNPAPVNDVVIAWTPELEQMLRRISKALTLFPRERILFYGAGLDLRAICASTLLYGRNNVGGAIDDDAALHGTLLGGHCPVYPPSEIEALRPDVIVVSSTTHRDALFQKARHLARTLPCRAEVFY